MMNDVTDPSETPQSSKIPQAVVAVNDTPQPIQPKDSAATKVNGVKAIGVNGTNGVHHEASDSGEPASKRVKLDNGKPAARSHRVDARDKVKGVALVKEE
jgi:hypothetical protein